MNEMSGRPLVSVVIAAYNHERYVEQSIRSVIDQDYPEIELIVLNDGSKDRTADVIRSLEAECRARFVRYEFIDKPNEGLARTLNRALNWSRGEFFTGVASDDLMKPCKVSALMAALADAPPDVGLACGDADFLDDDGRYVDMGKDMASLVARGEGYATFLEQYLSMRPDIDPARNFFSYETLIRGNYIPAMSVIWRRSALEQVGAWTPGNAIEDWDIWLRLARQYRCLYVPRVVASYRIHATNMVKTGVAALRMGMDQVYAREFPHLRDDRVLARFVAREWLKNSRRLSRAGYRAYLVRYLRPDILLAAIGLAPLGMPRSGTGK